MDGQWPFMYASLLDNKLRHHTALASFAWFVSSHVIARANTTSLSPSPPAFPRDEVVWMDRDPSDEPGEARQGEGVWQRGVSRKVSMCVQVYVW